MSNDPSALQIAVSSLIAAALPDITVRRGAEVLTTEEMPGVNVMWPEQGLQTEFAVGDVTFSFLSTLTLRVDCYGWGQDHEESWISNAALVRSVTNILRQTANRQIDGAAVMSRVSDGAPINADAPVIGFTTAYSITLEADVYEGQT